MVMLARWGKGGKSLIGYQGIEQGLADSGLGFGRFTNRPYKPYW